MHAKQSYFGSMIPSSAFALPGIALALAVLTGFSVPASGQLMVDFNSTTQDGGPTLQDGYQAYNAAHENAGTFTTQNFTAFGTTITVTPGWPNTTDARVRQMIDRAAGNDNNWGGDKLDLLTDWLGIDSRTANGGNGNWTRDVGSTPTYMTLDLGGLPAGSYQWTSYHHDTENVWCDFQVEVSIDGGTTYGPPIDMQMTDSTAGGNPASPLAYTGNPDPDPRNLPSTLTLPFDANGIHHVVFRFTCFADGVDPQAVHKQLFGINGFDLDSYSPFPSISRQPLGMELILGETLSLSVSARASLPVSLQWRKDEIPLSGANQTNYTFNIAVPTDAGVYDVIASTAVGSVTSDTAVVSVGLPDIDPPSQIVFSGFPADFSITMPSNGQSYTYAWSGPSGPLAGATNPAYGLTEVTVAEAGTYTVDVTLGSDTLSQTTTVIVPNPPTESYPNTIKSEGPIGYWRLGESMGVTYAMDETSPYLPFYAGGSTQFEQPGVILGDTNTSARFNGTADTALTGESYSSHVNTAQFSVEFWAHPTGGTGRRMAMCSRDVLSELTWVEGYEIGLNTDGRWEFRTGRGMVPAQETSWNILEGPAAVMGEWEHVVASYDGADMVLYLAGVPAATLTNVTLTAQQYWPARIGGGRSELTTAQDVFVGALDEVAYYNRALTPGEILDHYAASRDVTTMPVITEHPAPQAALIGGQAVFEVTVVSGSYPSFQWQKEGVPLEGATSQTLVLDPVEYTEAGYYEVVVSNNVGAVLSDPALLVPLLDNIGTFVLPDNSNTVLTRDDSSDWFVVEDAVAADTQGKWNRRGVFTINPGFSPWGFQGVANSELAGDLELRTTLSGLNPNTDYAVWTFFSDKAGPPEFSRILSGFDGEELTLFTQNSALDTGFIAQSEADPWPVYQCYLGVRTSDIHGNIRVLADFAPSAGRTIYQGVGYQLAFPTAEPPVISVDPVSEAALIGSNATFTVAAGSLLPMEYQWQVNGTDLVGETNITLNLSGVQKADAGKYRVLVSNTEGSTASAEANLVVLVDYVGTLVLPDSGNTVLTRNGSSDWRASTLADAMANGQWMTRPEFAVPTLPSMTEGYFATSSMEVSGDLKIRTTLTSLTPGEEYAVWVLYSFPPGGTANRIAAALDGDILTTWDDGLGQYTGHPSTTAGWALYQGFLGVRAADPSGEIRAVVDFRGLSNSAYNGLGYQLAVLPSDSVEVMIDSLGGTLTLSWPAGSGVLQESEDLTDPTGWQDVPGATSPYVIPATGSDKVYRMLR